MFLPLRTDSPLRSTPYMNWALIAANVVMFIIQHLYLGDDTTLALDTNDPHLYQYFTYQFLHGDGLHIASNMLFLYIFGNNVNDRLGNWGYLAFYLAGGVAAGIAYMLFSGGAVVGASGSIAAVTGAYLVLLPTSHVTVVYFFYLIGTIELPSVYFIIFYFIQDFIYSFAGMSTQVAHVAHLGGSIFGFVTCFSLLSAGMLPRNQFDLFALFQRWNRRRQYRDIVRQGYDPFGVVPPGMRSSRDPNLERIQDLRAQISEALAHHKVDDAARYYLELHAIDPQQVLSRQSQLDVANQLFSTSVHGAAADAYEAFIRAYPKYEQLEQIQLMLGLLYARYLNRPDLARRYLTASIERLSDPRQIELARAELATVG